MAAGYVIKTSDGVVGTSGTPKIIYGIHVESGGGAGTVVLRNGTSTSDTAVFTCVGTASAGVMFNFGSQGVIFPSGCYYDEDTSVASATILYKEL